MPPIGNRIRHGLGRAREYAIRAMGGHTQQVVMLPEDRPRAQYGNIGDDEESLDDTNRKEHLALARKMNRIFQADHEKLDAVDNLDDVYDEMDRDAIVKGAKWRLRTGIAQGDLTFEAGREHNAEQHVRFQEVCWDQDGRPFRNALNMIVESYCRGFALGEEVDGEFDAGEFVGMIRPRSITFKKRGSYRLQEDGFGRPSALQIEELRERVDRPPVDGMLTGHGLLPTRTVTLNPVDTPQKWARYVFTTFPEDIGRVAGDGAYVSIWGHWFFRQHLWQWVRTLCERTGTPMFVAEFAGQGGPSELVGSGKYPVTRDEVFNTLEQLQQHFRGVLPSGWKIVPVQTGAEGLAAMLQNIAQLNQSEIEVGLVLQDVGSGGGERGATVGGNKVILEGSFGGLVVEQQQRLAGLINARGQRYLRMNWGRISDPPRARFSNPDPEKDAERRTAVGEGLVHRVYSRHEPWLREVFGDGPPVEEVVEDTRKARAAAMQIGDDDTDASAGAFDPVSVREIVFDLQDARIPDSVARAGLRQMLPKATPDEIEQIIADAKAMPRGDAGEDRDPPSDPSGGPGGGGQPQSPAPAAAQFSEEAEQIARLRAVLPDASDEQIASISGHTRDGVHVRSHTRSDPPGGEHSEPFGEDHDTSMVGVHVPMTEGLQAIHALVPDADLYRGENEPERYGRESEPHVTVKYGLHTADVQDVRRVLEGVPPFTLSFGKVAVFSREEKPYDVIVVEVRAPELHAMHSMLRAELPNEETFPTYRPHVTIAYVKKGRGREAVGSTAAAGEELEVDSLWFHPLRSKVTRYVSLGGGEDFADDTPLPVDEIPDDMLLGGMEKRLGRPVSNKELHGALRELDADGVIELGKDDDAGNRHGERLEVDGESFDRVVVKKDAPSREARAEKREKAKAKGGSGGGAVDVKSHNRAGSDVRSHTRSDPPGGD